MCEQCGCSVFLAQGTAARLERAVAIIKELGVTTENVQAFEDGERICNLVIASKVLRNEDEEVHAIAEWVLGLHENVYAQRSRAYSRAAREIFANFPAKGSPRDIITIWHQLEEVTRGLRDDFVSSVGESGMADVIRAVQHVHDNPRQRLAELLERYKVADLL